MISQIPGHSDADSYQAARLNDLLSRTSEQTDVTKPVEVKKYLLEVNMSSQNNLIVTRDEFLTPGESQSQRIPIPFLGWRTKRATFKDIQMGLKKLKHLSCQNTSKSL